MHNRRWNHMVNLSPQKMHTTHCIGLKLRYGQRGLEHLNCRSCLIKKFHSRIISILLHASIGWKTLVQPITLLPDNRALSEVQVESLHPIVQVYLLQYKQLSGLDWPQWALQKSHSTTTVSLIFYNLTQNPNPMFDSTMAASYSWGEFTLYICISGILHT